MLFSLLVGALFVTVALLSGRGEGSNPLAVGTATGIVGALLVRTALAGARERPVDWSDPVGFLRKKAVDYVATFVGFVAGAVVGTVALGAVTALAG